MDYTKYSLPPLPFLSTGQDQPLYYIPSNPFGLGQGDSSPDGTTQPYDFLQPPTSTPPQTEDPPRTQDNLNISTGDDPDNITYLGSNSVFNTNGGRDVFLIDGSSGAPNGNNNTVDTGDGDDIMSVFDGNNNSLSLGDGDDVASIGNGDSSGTDAQNNTFDGGAGDDVLWVQDGTGTVVAGGEGNDTVMLYGNKEDWERTVNGDGTVTFTNIEYGTEVTLQDDVENVGFTSGTSDPNGWQFFNPHTDQPITGAAPVTETFETTVTDAEAEITSQN